MKKVALLVAVFATLSLVSCKKTYTCDMPDGSLIPDYECEKCGKTEKTAFESGCTLIGGTVK